MTRQDGEPEITLQSLTITLAEGLRKAHLSITKINKRATWRLTLEGLEAAWFTARLLEAHPELNTEDGLQIQAPNLVEAERKVRELLTGTNWELSRSALLYGARPIVPYGIIRVGSTNIRLTADQPELSFNETSEKDEVYVQRLIQSPLCTAATWDGSTLCITLTDKAAETLETFQSTIKHLIGLRYRQ